MRRWVGWAASLALAAGLVTAGATSASAAVPAASSRPATCTGTIQITSFVFVPPAVPAGGSSTATLNARNCTGQTQQTGTTWLGRYIGSTTGIPPGCPVIDPLPRPATFPPHGSISLSTTYLTFASCTASALQVTVRITGSAGTLLATATATLIIQHP
jgi:hypothetical protein